MHFGARCPKGLRSVGETITLWELARLVRILRSDPSSALTAALEGWDFPISREALALYDLFDLTVAANTDSKKGKPPPHPGRPFTIDETSSSRSRGDAAGRSPEQVMTILREQFGRRSSEGGGHG